MEKGSNLDSNYLFPNKFKIIGLLFAIPGAILAVIRFYYGIKPAIFDFKVFAFYSKYFESVIFSPISNHFSEEITGILLIVGLLFIAFSKDKNEDDIIKNIRYKSLIISIFINSGLMILSFLFIFGFAFVNVLILNVYSLLIIYIIVFQFYKYKYQNK